MTMPHWRIVHGDALAILRTLPEESVHCCVTSPPYFGLRDYGVTGQIGLERTPEEYTTHVVEIFREVRRVLRADATCWLNLGDCYATGAGKVGDHPGGGAQGNRWAGRGTHTAENSGKAAPRLAALGPMTQPNRLPLPGLKPKDLIGIPWRVAFALQADGWWLRSDITWCKTAPLPESVRDRPTSATEQVFLLTKSRAYFYDQDAERVPYAPDSLPRVQRGRSDDHKFADGGPGNQTLAADIAGACTSPLGRNLWNYWVLNPEPFTGAHFATMPTELARRCIRLGTSKRGCCPTCGAAWRRVVQRTARTDGRANLGDRERDRGGRQDGFTKAPSGQITESVTVGWCPTCGHYGEGGWSHRTVAACTVLDPFCGSGTVGLVALRHGRSFIGIELNADYVRMAETRIRADAPLLNHVSVEPAAPVAAKEGMA